MVNSEEEMEGLHLDNAVAFRKDQRALYFRDKEGWKPIQVMNIDQRFKYLKGIIIYVIDN